MYLFEEQKIVTWMFCQQHEEKNKEKVKGNKDIPDPLEHIVNIENCQFICEINALKSNTFIFHFFLKFRVITI